MLGRDEALYVDEETFRLWLLYSEFSFGLAVQRWWTGLASSEEGAVDGLKGEDDETSVELFRRICGDLRKLAEEGEGNAADVSGGSVWLPALLQRGGVRGS